VRLDPLSNATAPDGSILVFPTALGGGVPGVPSACDFLDDLGGDLSGEVKASGSSICEALNQGVCFSSGVEPGCYGGGHSYTILGRSYVYQNYNPTGWGHKVSFWGVSGDCNSGSYGWPDLRAVPRGSFGNTWDNVISSHKSYNDCTSYLYAGYGYGGSNDVCKTETDCPDIAMDNQVSSIFFS
jgi:hypothetical protein